MQVASATNAFRRPDFWVGLDRQRRALYGAIAVSIVLHAIVLAIRFSLPDAPRAKPVDQPLDVVLVNAKTKEKPVHADVLAQSNLNRGGNTDQNRRAKTPLPVMRPSTHGSDLAAARKRVRQLEQAQRELLAKSAESPAHVAPKRTQKTPAKQPEPHVSGRDLADLSLAAMKLQAQIDRRIEDYQKRPRMKFIGARAKEYRFAQYEEEWRHKIERVGTLNYPSRARGKLYGNLRLTVTIRPDGSVKSIELDRSSGLKILDAAAFKIVRMAAPFAPFPPDIRKDTDLLVITRTWFFGRGDKIWTE